MLSAITTKLEIDAIAAAELDQIIQFAVVHRLPAVIVPPQFSIQAIALRVKRRGKFKIITTVDWPRGDHYSMLKLRGMSIESLQTDGFEIMLTIDKSDAETKNEMKILSSFLTQNISPLIDIRFVLGTNSRSLANSKAICAMAKDIPTPTLLRTDIATKIQITKANLKVHTALLSELKLATGCQIKISGNIDSVKTATGCLLAGASKLAVNLQQAQAIVRDLQKQPDISKLLEEPTTT